jgi:large subunit ribosomal protein L6
MSKIVNRELKIPENIKLEYNEELRKLLLNGPNGSFSFVIDESVDISINSGVLKTSSNNNEKKALAGTINSLVFNAINGAMKDYEVVLEIKGIGYKASISNDNKINISAGFSHDVKLEIPEDVKIECLGSKITVKSHNKQKAGWFAARIRDIRKPNVFVKSLKGIFYQKEIANFKIKPGKRNIKK